MNTCEANPLSKQDACNINTVKEKYLPQTFRSVSDLMHHHLMIIITFGDGCWT